MKITKGAMDSAVDEGILSEAQSSRLLAFLQGQPEVGPSFNLTHVLYYLGGLIAIGAMTLFMGLGWEAFGGWGIVCISLLYAVGGLGLASRFRKHGYAIPAGICATFAVFLTPLFIYGLQQALGVWPVGNEYRDYHRYIHWHWLYMELGTLVSGLIVARLYRYPFLVLPIAFTLWYLSMDLAAMLAGERPDFELRTLVSLYFGLLMLGLAFWVDIRARRSADYAFWLYLFGVLTFWGGLTAQNSDSELSKLFYFAINLVMMGLGVMLVRRVLVVFGALGSSFYLGYLAHSVFEQSLFFPVALTAIGLAIIYLGVLWQRNERNLTVKVRSVLPAALRELLESKDCRFI